MRRKLLYLIWMIFIIRIGCQIPVPGVDSDFFKQWFSSNAGDAFNFFDAFTGGSFERMSIFALNITPYITSSIIIQLLTIAIPALEEMQRDGEEGRKKMTAITRYVTVGLALFESIAMAIGFGRQGMIPNLNFFKGVVVVACLTAGSAMLMWLGERITERGIGNGISLIIMIGIIARLPQAFMAEVLSKAGSTTGGILLLIVEFVILFFVFVAAIALVQAVRKVPVQYANRVIGNKQYGGVRQYIPLKVNASGVMPIIFAQAIMLFPIIFSRFDATRGFAAAMSNYTGLWYNLVFGFLVIVFTYFYTAVTFQPNMMAEDMKKNGGFIPGVKPGKKTMEYLDTIMTRIVLPGSIFLAIIAVLPAIATLCGVNNQFASFYGGTSLLILVGVVLDTLQQVESHLLMRHYDGLMKTGRLTGRSGM